MANIYGVAKQARVSVATVSAVVNGRVNVSPQLRARVQDAIDRLGYRPNLIARSLAKQRTHTLGMIVPDIANPFWPDVVRGAEDKAHEAGYTLLLSNSDDDRDKEALYLRLFHAKRVDGVLLAKAPGRTDPEIARAFASAAIPITDLLRVSNPAHDAVLLDDKDAAYEAVSHLVRLGHRRIAMISGRQSVTTSRRRVQGYRAALKGHGPIDPTLCYEGDFRVDSGYVGGLELLKRRPDAVFISNYQMAVGFMKAMRQHQLRCPQDVAIVTCDDHPWVDSFAPRLTTVNFPKYQVGAEAVRLLVSRLGDRKRPKHVVQLRSALTIRDSCGLALRSAAV